MLENVARSTRFIIFVFIILFSPWAWTFEPNSGTIADFYVSLNGSDGNAGSFDAPFYSVEQAKMAVRKKIVEGLSRDITVRIRGGTYFVEKPLIFDVRDSGTDRFSITYTAFPGEEVTLSGGRNVTGWTENPDGSWSVFVDDLGTPFRELFLNGRRLQRARYPNDGYLYMQKAVNRMDSFIFKPKDIPKTNDLSGMEIVYLRMWSISRSPIKTIDYESNTLTTDHDIGADVWWLGLGMSPNEPYYLENSELFLDRPGEWYHNHKTGILTYLPCPHEKIESSQFIIPVASKLLCVSGNSETDLYVQNLRFSGMHFEHCAYQPPDNHYLGVQACFFVKTGKNMVGGNDAVPFTENPWFQIPAAIEFSMARNCKVTDCRIRHIGCSALRLGRGCRDNEITGNLISDIAANGIMVGEASRERVIDGEVWWLKAPEQAACGNIVRNNLIETCGQLYFGAVAVWTGIAEKTLISHNRIQNLPYSGISLGWLWSNQKTPCRENCIENNHISNVLNILTDGGAIYLLGRHDNSVVRGNLIEGVNKSYTVAQNNGIRWDRGASEFLIEYNVVTDVSNAILFFNPETQNSLITRNIFSVKSLDDIAAYNNVSNKDTILIRDNQIFSEYQREFIQPFIDMYRWSSGLEPAYRGRLRADDMSCFIRPKLPK